MAITPEDRSKLYERAASSLDFLSDFRTALTLETEGVRNLRGLDYGAGTNSPWSLFDYLHPDQSRLVAYDPHMPEGAYSEADSQFEMPGWVGKPPEGRFDLVVCHFSLHHIDMPLEEIILSLRKYGGVLGIAEYDYSKSSKAEFAETFVNQQEQKELEELFSGDMAAAYAFHRRLSRQDFRKALEQHGYKVAQEGQGKGLSRHKFFMVGRSTQGN